MLYEPQGEELDKIRKAFGLSEGSLVILPMGTSVKARPTMDLEWDEENPPSMADWAAFISAGTTVAQLASDLGETETAKHVLRQIATAMTHVAYVTVEDPADPEMESVKEGRDPR